MPNSSAPAGASGNPAASGPRASAYQPAAQPAADAALQAAVAAFPLYGNLTPAGMAYPQAQQITAAGADPNNPYLQQAIGAGQSAYGTYGSAFGGIPGAIGGDLSSYLQNVLPQITGNAGYASSFAPGLIGGGGNLLNYSAQQVPALQAMTDPAAAQLFSQGNDLAAWANSQIAGMGNYLNPSAANLVSSGNQILGTAFDPQNALYNQLSQQVQQQARAANAAAGLGGTAYGAGQESGALSNFDINWQNQQLARQAQGLSAAQGAYGGAGALLGMPLTAKEQVNASLGGTYGQIPGLMGAPISLDASTLGAAGNILGQGANLAGAPASALAAAFGPLGTGQQIGSTGLTNLQSFAGLPFNTQTTAAGNQLGLLGQTVNIGNQQFQIPQQVINDLQSYLGLGQSASALSGQLGNLGQQQLFNSLGGFGSAASLLGNPFSSGSSSGLLGGALGNPFSSSSGGLFGGSLGGLFGGGATDFAGAVPGFDAAAAASAAAPAAFGFDAAGSALAGAADFGGGIDFASALPLLALGA